MEWGGARWTFVTRVGRGSPRSQPGPRAPGGRCSLSGARTGSSFLLAAPRGGLRPPWASASLSVRERTGRDGRASCFRHTFRSAGRVGPRGLLPRGAGLPAGTEQAGTGAADPRAQAPAWLAKIPATGIAEATSHTALGDRVRCWQTPSREAIRVRMRSSLIRRHSVRSVSDLCQTNK